MVLALVRTARRRIAGNEALREGANAISVAVAAFLVLLVLGTQVLAWYRVLLLPVAAAIVALYRVRRHMPSPYVIAQKVDQRMGLSDTLATAFYFSTAESGSKGSPELRRLQLAEAERVSEGIDVRKAIPYTIPRGAYIAAALLLIAGSVFGLRYGLTDRLDLKQPLARILQQRLGWGSTEQRASLQPQRNDKVPFDNTLDQENGEQANPSDPSQQPDPTDTYAGDQPQASQGKADNNSKNGQNELEPDSSGQDQPDQAEDPNAAGNQNAANSKDGQQKGKQSQSASSGDSKSADNQSLLSKMKEAMQNLLSSMQQPNQQNASNQNGKSDKGQQSQNKPQAQKGDKKNAQMNESQDQQAADDGEQAQNAQGQSADKTDSPMANKQPGSGAGNKDGAKDVKLAEQLAAMGKISEIIGKRAANVTGEVTVDVQNTSQQLRTGYQERHADHTQAGAEINRDEIPVALESYVTQYFEQVRKQPAGQK
jgi:hypothetical protein